MPSHQEKGLGWDRDQAWLVSKDDKTKYIRFRCIKREWRQEFRDEKHTYMSEIGK